MNSRERVLAAVNYQKPDRVPIDLSAMGASGINAAVGVTVSSGHLLLNITD